MFAIFSALLLALPSPARAGEVNLGFGLAAVANDPYAQTDVLRSAADYRLAPWLSFGARFDLAAPQEVWGPTHDTALLEGLGIEPSLSYIRWMGQARATVTPIHTRLSGGENAWATNLELFGGLAMVRTHDPDSAIVGPADPSTQDEVHPGGVAGIGVSLERARVGTRLEASTTMYREDLYGTTSEKQAPIWLDAEVYWRLGRRAAKGAGATP